MTALVTVGMPVYNSERYLSEALDSVRAQDFENIEILISDNGSTDGTEEICRQAAAEDVRIVYLRADHNHGGAWNMNHLVDRARAPLFKWAFYDDLLAPTLVGRCVEELMEAGSSAVLAYPRAMDVDAEGVVVAERNDGDLGLEDHRVSRRLYRLLETMAEQAIFGVIRTESLRATKGIQSTVSDGMILLTELCLQGRFIPVGEQLFFFRVHAGQHGGNRAREMQWYGASRGGRYIFPYTRVNGYLYSAVFRAPLDAADRASCMGAVTRGWTVKKWRSYASDLKNLGSDLAKAPPPTPLPC